MKYKILFFIPAIFILLFISACAQKQITSDLNINNIAMKLTSPIFTNNSNLPSQYTCDGEGINPPLEISEVPLVAKSLVLIVDDPDAPITTFVHWLVWNINPKTTEISVDSVPSGSIQGANSARKSSYFPPCPPSGTHRYVFKLYALDIELDLAANTDKKALEQAMDGHILDSAELIGLYKR